MKKMTFHSLLAFSLVVIAFAQTNARAEVSTDAVAETVEFDTTLRLTFAEGVEAADKAGMPNQAKAADFLQGSWTFQAYGSASFGDDAGELYLGHIGFGYYLWDHISVNFEGVFGVVESDFTAPDGDGYAVGFDLLARWHFCNWGDLTIFAEGGVGMIWFEENFPQVGTHQNFTPQVGVGAAYDLFNGCRLMGGVRWHHISNAGKTGGDRNPGYDGAMVYLGVMVPF